MHATAERIQFHAVPRSGEFFKLLSPAALSDFETLEWPASYPAKATLFTEQQVPSSVLVLLEGQVKLSINAPNGKRLILRIAEAGDILGLISAFSGNPYEVTAEALHFCRVASLRRNDFLGFLGRHPDAYQNIAQQLSMEYVQDCARLRTVGLTSSAPAKVAQLLLEWCGGAATWFKLPVTQQEMGECIGTSRETVTRTLKDFKRRHMVDMHGSTLIILNRQALEAYAGVVVPERLHVAVKE